MEGDSAGGSAKQGRDRKFQAILPLRGKSFKYGKSEDGRHFEKRRDQYDDLYDRSRCRESFDVNDIEYDKVIIMTDADVDGSHIQCLLLTFFYRYMRPLIEEGHLYIAQPPLYLVRDGKKKRTCITKTD